MSSEGTSLPGSGAAQLPFLGSQVIRRLVPMADAIEASRRAFAAQQRGELETPQRVSLDHGRLLLMPAVHASGQMVLKLIAPQVGGRPEAPVSRGLVLWMEGESGAVSALLDVGAVTGLRTGAASGLASSILAPPGARTLAMLGAGTEAADQVAAVLAVRPISEVRIASRSFERAEELARRLTPRHPGVELRAVSSWSEAVRGAQVVSTATRSSEPLFTAANLGPEVHVNAVGSYRPGMVELPPELLDRATQLVVDQVGAALAEAGEIVAAISEGRLVASRLVELGSLLERAPTRSGLTVFKSVGLAAQDWALTELTVRRAREVGLLPG